MADKYLAISGGVGGAKLALGLAHILAPEELTIVANTGDDFEHFGLKICPDLDTVMYTLADLSNKEQGWGLAGESWNFLERLSAYGAPDWFALGDKDLATHVVRTRALAEGADLETVTSKLCSALGIRHPLVPMTNEPVSTVVKLRDGGELMFQHYFVRDRCEPAVSGFRFAGIESSTPSAGLAGALADESLKAIIICPSNPFVSVDPVLAVPGVLQSMRVPVIAVSPIVGGQALKGPAAKMMAELGMPTDVVTVARHYATTIDGLVIDNVDADRAPEIEALGLPTTVTGTVMLTLADRKNLAADVLEFAKSLSATTPGKPRQTHV
jgi:LPPG:FO 2-phospho-L-lactate transferase